MKTLRNVAIALLLALCIAGNAAAAPAAAVKITKVTQSTKNGNDVWLVTFSDGNTYHMGFTALSRADDPKVGAVTNYAPYDGWFSDGATFTQSNHAFTVYK